MSEEKIKVTNMVGDHKSGGLSVSQNKDHEVVWEEMTQKAGDVFHNNISLPLSNINTEDLLKSYFNDYRRALGYGPNDQKEFEREFWKRMYFPKKKNHVLIGNGYYIKYPEDDSKCYLYREGEKKSLGEFYKQEHKILEKGSNILAFFKDDGSLLVLNPFVKSQTFMSAIKYKDMAGSPYIAIKDVYRNTMFLNTETMKCSRAMPISGYYLTEDRKTLLLKRRWLHFLKPYVLLAEDRRVSKPFCSYDSQSIDPFFILYNRKGKAIDTFRAYL